MQSLLFIIASIALTGALIYGGTNLLKSDLPNRVQAKNNITSAFYTLATAYQSYLKANGVVPDTASWKTQLVPAYLQALPVLLSSSTATSAWSFANDATYGNYFCWSDSVPQAFGNGASDASASFPASSYIVDNAACGVRTGTLPSSWPATIYITYWLQGS